MYGVMPDIDIFTPDAAIQKSEAALPPVGMDCHGLALPILAMTGEVSPDIRVKMDCRGGKYIITSNLLYLSPSSRRSEIPDE